MNDIPAPSPSSAPVEPGAALAEIFDHLGHRPERATLLGFSPLPDDGNRDDTDDTAKPLFPERRRVEYFHDVPQRTNLVDADAIAHQIRLGCAGMAEAGLRYRAYVAIGLPGEERTLLRQKIPALQRYYSQGGVELDIFFAENVAAGSLITDPEGAIVDHMPGTLGRPGAGDDLTAVCANQVFSMFQDRSAVHPDLADLYREAARAAHAADHIRSTQHRHDDSAAMTKLAGDYNVWRAALMRLVEATNSADGPFARDDAAVESFLDDPDLARAIGAIAAAPTLGDAVIGELLSDEPALAAAARRILRVAAGLLNPADAQPLMLYYGIGAYLRACPGLGLTAIRKAGSVPGHRSELAAMVLELIRVDDIDSIAEAYRDLGAGLVTSILHGSAAGARREETDEGE